MFIFINIIKDILKKKTILKVKRRLLVTLQFSFAKAQKNDGKIYIDVQETKLLTF